VLRDSVEPVQAVAALTDLMEDLRSHIHLVDRGGVDEIIHTHPAQAGLFAGEINDCEGNLLEAVFTGIERAVQSQL